MGEDIIDTGSASETTGGQASEAGEIPAWATALTAKVDGRLGEFGRDIARLRDKIKKPKDPDNGSATQPAETAKGGSITREELAAATRLGEIKASVSEDARAEIDTMLEGGASYAEVCRAADLLVRFGAAAMKASAESGANPQTIHGSARTAARKTAPEYPRSQHEWIEIKRKAATGDVAAKGLWDRLMEDPAFDPSELPARQR